MTQDFKKIIDIDKLKDSDVLIYDNSYAVAIKYKNKDKKIITPILVYKSKNVKKAVIMAKKISKPCCKNNIASDIALVINIGEHLVSSMFTQIATIMAETDIFTPEEQDFDKILNNSYLNYKRDLYILSGKDLEDMLHPSESIEKITTTIKGVISDFGLLQPDIKILTAKTLTLKPNEYVIKIGDFIFGRGTVFPNKFLVLETSDGSNPQKIEFDETDPIFDVPAKWVDKKDDYEDDYMVVSPLQIINAHVSDIIKKNLTELLTRQSIYQILEILKINNSEKYVEDILNIVPIETIQVVLLNLLKEQVPIRDIEKILETISINYENCKDTDILTELVRQALCRYIWEYNITETGELFAIIVAPNVENMVKDNLISEVGFVQNFIKSFNKEFKNAISEIKTNPVILCSSPCRLPIRRLLSTPPYSNFSVMCYDEIVTGEKVKKVGTIRFTDKNPIESIISIACNQNQNHNSNNNNDNNNNYNIDLINCSRDIKFLTEKIIQSKNLNFSMCIYGDSGTGKSAYAKYLAEQLGIKVIRKNASDILDKYVGNSEKFVAEAFEEAKDKNAMLIIDEVDSFLRSKDFAQRNWEVSLVNQMLTSMEDFELPFICTTNYIDTLDQASLRRFTFKLKFGFLKPEKIESAFNYIFDSKPNAEILNMQGLTVSDFINTKKECDILNITDIDTIAKILKETVSLKKSEDLVSNIGF